MKNLTKTKLLVSAAVALVFAASYTARAQTIIGVEDPTNGFTGAIPLNVGSIGVASDGETALLPFGLTNDVSDAINFDTVGNGLATGWFITQGAAHWTQKPGTQIWYIDAVQVGENEPAFNELVGVWQNPGGGWAPNLLGEYRINDPDGTWDQIDLFNDPLNGNASVSFNSDAPEPGALTLLGIGIASLVCYRGRRGKVAVQG